MVLPLYRDDRACVGVALPARAARAAKRVLREGVATLSESSLVNVWEPGLAGSESRGGPSPRSLSPISQSFSHQQRSKLQQQQKKKNK
ncbi:hypothetical protein Taro_037158 [Colocasia esculenta]|uniref:Uncharacterized protein n=1 Tax=Colocasia esculenta TaxID=4460 RepID=A0A843WJZ4_COLES|nr:hypothetical protein [Colocasia esculenta]